MVDSFYIHRLNLGSASYTIKRSIVLRPFPAKHGIEWMIAD